MATVTLGGKPCHTNGELPAVGVIAPDFVLVDGRLKNISLKNFSGKKKVLNIVPSLDTGTCQASTRRFNELAAGRDDLVMLIVSGDLPFAQKRFCEEARAVNVKPLSMMRSRKFAKDYGVLLDDGPLAGVTARAVVVLDEHNKVVYRQLVGEIANEPDYDSAMRAV